MATNQQLEDLANLFAGAVGSRFTYQEAMAAFCTTIAHSAFMDRTPRVDRDALPLYFAQAMQVALAQALLIHTISLPPGTLDQERRL